MDLLQWNVNGFRTRLPDLQPLIQFRNPAILCLQETHLRPSHALKLSGFTAHRYDHPHGEGASGGTAIIVKDCI
jgi:exonuclease III